MKNFRKYARYYDLLYRDKDYGAETDYLDRLIQTHCPGASRVLNLGCGTGNHDFRLQAKGYRMTGVDLSAENIALAREKLDAETAAVAGPEFHEGDLCAFRLNRKFDAVISVFHVISYLTTNEALQAAFTTAGEHLSPAGLFIFDCWYGPAVLSQLPATRVKRVTADDLTLTRIAEPDIRYNANRVDVHYELIVQNRSGGSVERIRETHRMRYLFRPEIADWLSAAGLELVAAEEWLSGNPIGRDSWGSCFIARQGRNT